MKGEFDVYNLQHQDAGVVDGAREEKTSEPIFDLSLVETDPESARIALKGYWQHRSINLRNTLLARNAGDEDVFNHELSLRLLIRYGMMNSGERDGFNPQLWSQIDRLIDSQKLSAVRGIGFQIPLSEGIDRFSNIDLVKEFSDNSVNRFIFTYCPPGNLREFIRRTDGIPSVPVEKTSET